MKKRVRAFLISSVLLAAMVFSGCALKPVVDSTRFYVLGVENYEPVSAEREEKGVIVGISRVQLARYLDSPEIVVRERENRILYSKNDRWAEPLEYGVVRLLAVMLREELAIADVIAFPMRTRSVPDFDLYVSILRAEGVIAEEDSHAELEAVWELRADNRVVADGAVWENSLHWDGEDIEQLVAVLSSAVAGLSEQVAGAIEKL